MTKKTMFAVLSAVAMAIYTPAAAEETKPKSSYYDAVQCSGLFMLYGTFLGEKSPDIAQMYQSKARSWILFATDNLGKSMNVVFVDAEEASRSMLDKLTNLPTGSDSEQVMAEEEASCDKLSVTHGVK